MTIWKFPLQITDIQVVQVPEGAQFLSVKSQHGRPRLWALVDENKENQTQPWAIELFGTGHRMPDGERQFLGTVLTNEDDLVWHVFRKI